MTALGFAHPSLSAPRVAASPAPLRWHERAALAIGVFEIPLQIDKYFLFHEPDAQLGAVGGINVSVTTLAIVYLYAAWLVSSSLERRPLVSRPVVGYPLVVYFLTVAVSVASASVRWLAVFDLVLLAQAYALFFYLANRLRTRGDFVFCMAAIAATLLCQSLIVLGLALVGDSFAGQEFSVGPVVFSVWSDGRPAGTLHSAVVVGSLMAILWLPVATLTLVVKAPRVWWFAAVATGAGMLAILATQTRGAILTAGVGAVLVGAGLFRRRALPPWAISMAVLLAIAAAYPMARVIEARVRGDDNGSAESRVHLSAIAWDTIKQRPLFGYGAGNCHLACKAAANSGLYRSEWYYTIHSKYLLVWVETGAIGLAAFLLMMLSSVRTGLGAWATRHPFYAPLGLALAVAIVGHMLHMAVDVFNSRSQVQMLWAIMGVAAAAGVLARQRQGVGRVG